jgi:hypothetical protein
MNECFEYLFGDLGYMSEEMMDWWVQIVFDYAIEHDEGIQ